MTGSISQPTPTSVILSLAQLRAAQGERKRERDKKKREKATGETKRIDRKKDYDKNSKMDPDKYAF